MLTASGLPTTQREVDEVNSVAKQLLNFGGIERIGITWHEDDPVGKPSTGDSLGRLTNSTIASAGCHHPRNPKRSGQTSGISKLTTQPRSEQLARLHHRFECIHPFIDGNGRAGRLAMNLVLVRLGYPPVVIFKKQRDSYLRGLQRCDAGDHGALGEIIAEAMLDNLNRFVVPNIAGPARLVPLAVLADKQFTIPALRQAAQRGRLDATQGPDGIWRSSRHAVNDYAATKHTRRPKTT